MKFAPTRGYVSVVVRADLTLQRAVVEISDTGIGITSGELTRVFEAFAQGEHAAGGAHRFGGLGLGLAISRRVIELHPGRIGAESPGRDHGASFRVELPLQPLQTLGDGPAAQTPAGKL